MQHPFSDLSRGGIVTLCQWHPVSAIHDEADDATAPALTSERVVGCRAGRAMASLGMGFLRAGAAIGVQSMRATVDCGGSGLKAFALFPAVNRKKTLRSPGTAGIDVRSKQK